MYEGLNSVQTVFLPTTLKCLVYEGFSSTRRVSLQYTTRQQSATHENCSPFQPQAPAVAKTTGGKSEAEIKEEEELQLALALSQSEAEESEKRKKKRENSQFYSSAVGKDNSETAKNSSTEKV